MICHCVLQLIDTAHCHRSHCISHTHLLRGGVDAPRGNHGVALHCVLQLFEVLLLPGLQYKKGGLCISVHEGVFKGLQRTKHGGLSTSVHVLHC
jgi:hypothetical protein